MVWWIWDLWSGSSGGVRSFEEVFVSVAVQFDSCTLRAGRALVREVRFICSPLGRLFEDLRILLGPHRRKAGVS